MRVRIRLFARQREIAGAREVAVELSEAPPAGTGLPPRTGLPESPPAGSPGSAPPVGQPPPGSPTIEDAWAALVALHPALAAGRPYVRFALNGEYADPGTAVGDGDEVACIPPVSGGAGEAGADPRADRILELAPAPLPPDLGRALADRLATPADGAVVIFEGRTRETPGTPAPGEEAEARRHAGRRVEALEYEAFETLAVRVLGEIADTVADRFGVERLAIVHATGDVPLGDVSVVIVACAPHRDAAFDAARFAMDETKARAPIWKAERFADGHVWIGQVARTDPAVGPGPVARTEPG